MLQLAIIGAGQLGSRHLQALALIDRPAEIMVFDPFERSLATARERFEQISSQSKPRAHFTARMDELPRALDAAVIATTADRRLDALERLLARSSVRCLLLEKVLFQRLADYDAAEALLARSGTRAWVNCAQRLWPFFRDLRPRTLGKSSLHIAASGTQWGLGCNAIHNLDLLLFMTGDETCRIECALDPGTIPSKRQGFIEFTGTLYAHGERGNRVVQTSYRGGSAPFQFEMQGEDFHALWRVGEPAMRLADVESGWTWREVECRAPYQSQLTHSVLLEMIDQGRSALPDYAESAALHRAMLRAFLQHTHPGAVRSDEACAIT